MVAVPGTVLYNMHQDHLKLLWSLNTAVGRSSYSNITTRVLEVEVNNDLSNLKITSKKGTREVY